MASAVKDISVIIPCFNTNPEYLQEAVNSVLTYHGKYSYEIIITDDGSTNKNTLALLRGLEEQDIKILHQENKGPAAARNTGVKNCDSEYLLLLDSDNSIDPVYIDEGINALKLNDAAGVAYGNAHFFGESTRRNIEDAPFDITRILLNNYIDTCAVVRRKAWESVGGMDEEKLLIGHEDWEFWINLYAQGWQFIYLDKTLFNYRVATASLITKTSKTDFYNKLGYIYKKHWKVVHETYLRLYGKSVTADADEKRPLRSFIKYSRKKYFNPL